mmetsp:Transcript_11465/g.24456  ORF Transcript_11465/g.24456 Transcript_11465/m.24456 type:complete len:373 (-) Transcript_11465:721-1839(-)
MVMVQRRRRGQHRGIIRVRRPVAHHTRRLGGEAHHVSIGYLVNIVQGPWLHHDGNGLVHGLHRLQRMLLLRGSALRVRRLLAAAGLLHELRGRLPRRGGGERGAQRIEEELGIVLDPIVSPVDEVESPRLRTGVHAGVLLADLDVDAELLRDHDPIDLLVVLLGDGVVLDPEVIGMGDDLIQVGRRGNDDGRPSLLNGNGRHHENGIAIVRRSRGHHDHRLRRLGRGHHRIRHGRIRRRLRRRRPPRDLDRHPIAPHQLRRAPQRRLLLPLREFLALPPHGELATAAFLAGGEAGGLLGGLADRVGLAFALAEFGLEAAFLVLGGLADEFGGGGVVLLLVLVVLVGFGGEGGGVGVDGVHVVEERGGGRHGG